MRNENEATILSYLTPKQGIKKLAQLDRWVDRMIEQRDPAIKEFCKSYNAAESHSLRQHVLRIHRDRAQELTEEQLAESKLRFLNYVQQVALISDNSK